MVVDQAVNDVKDRMYEMFSNCSRLRFTDSKIVRFQLCPVI